MHWHLGLLGGSLGHSLSPVIQRAALASAGLDGDYALVEVDAAGVAAAIEALRRGAWHGLNVTLPHKVLAASLVDRLEGAAEALGAVNTLVRAPDGAVVGHNTDVSGLGRAAREELALGPLAGAAVAVIGAGGAARAAVLAALALGAGEVRVANRTPERAHELVRALGERHGEARLLVADDATAAARGAALLLQASSHGMGLAPDAGPWSEALSEALPSVAALAPGAGVLDLVYRPRRTPWCAAAATLGRPAAHGLGMLVHQAADAFALWTGRVAPRAWLRAAAEEALGP